jgi:hypothetical protein
MHANSGILVINAADWSGGGSKSLLVTSRSGYDVPNDNNYNCGQVCSVLTYDHDTQRFLMQ